LLQQQQQQQQQRVQAILSRMLDVKASLQQAELY
jgi:hypothetical protein